MKPSGLTETQTNSDFYQDLSDFLSIYYIGRWCPWRFAKFQMGLKDLEGQMSHWYPLGEQERFKISHGQDYWAFFHRLGSLTYQVVVLDGKIVAGGAGVRRRVESKLGTDRQLRCWYLCDLKVLPEYQGRRLSVKMLAKAFTIGYLKCPRFYGISMNPNQIVHRLAKMNPVIGVSVGCQLNLYSLDYAQMQTVAEQLRQLRGEIGFVNLIGVKDIILESTGQPMKLLHVQWGPEFRRKLKLWQHGWGPILDLDSQWTADWSRVSLEPKEGFNHMLCCPASDRSMVRLMKLHGIEVDSTATVYHHGMEGTDWKFILTSDI